jgi:hypothetical protein
MSTGARTPEGKARVLAALIEGRRRWMDEMREKKKAGLITRFPGGRKPGDQWVTPRMRQREMETTRWMRRGMNPEELLRAAARRLGASEIEPERSLTLGSGTETGGRFDNAGDAPETTAKTSTVAAIAKLTCLCMAASCCPLSQTRGSCSCPARKTNAQQRRDKELMRNTARTVFQRPLKPPEGHALEILGASRTSANISFAPDG